MRRGESVFVACGADVRNVINRRPRGSFNIVAEVCATGLCAGDTQPPGGRKAAGRVRPDGGCRCRG